ncbi:hypothetical protein PV08_05845 [Exophiala spinifera]|uniref:DUF1868 domain-containing protein n=1 Tax=Exophiala spinifera TaxID=91928 RepID=A0A0D2BB07_9EURO|nr:uncharacterized protein PV08_05845 [Exophiala spinifera]KIW15795.1 hypothetical protein PV08_05845 [Exophiala spinifera]
MATTTANRPRYPIGIPAKFSVDGEVQRYPGNTVLCHIPPSSPLIPALQAVYTALADHPRIAPSIHLLPPASWHMTVFDGMRERECEPGMWPPGMAKLSLAESTAIYREKLSAFGRTQLRELGLAPPYNMRVRVIEAGPVGIGLELEGATAEEERRMRRLRDAISDVLGFRAPNHDEYGFHVSIAYLMRHVDGESREELERVLKRHLPTLQGEVLILGAPEFCTFENMHAFPRIMYIGDGED